MRSAPLLFAACAALASAPLAFAAVGGPSGVVIREPGAVYLEDVVKRPVRVTLLEDAAVYYQSDARRLLGVMRRGQQVEVQAIGDGVYRVRGIAQQGQVAGWVETKFLAPLKPDFIASVRQNAARRAEVEALIARKEVAVNMTPEEVSAALGRPGKKASRVDATGRQETWEYTRYENVPQTTTARDQYGRVFQTVTYLKVPAGKLSVVFANNLVSSLEQTEGSAERDARVKIVAVPFAAGF